MSHDDKYGGFALHVSKSKDKLVEKSQLWFESKEVSSIIGKPITVMI